MTRARGSPAGPAASLGDPAASGKPGKAIMGGDGAVSWVAIGPPGWVRGPAAEVRPGDGPGSRLGSGLARAWGLADKVARAEGMSKLDSHLAVRESVGGSRASSAMLRAEPPAVELRLALLGAGQGEWTPSARAGGGRSASESASGPAVAGAVAKGNLAAGDARAKLDC